MTWCKERILSQWCCKAFMDANLRRQYHSVPGWLNSGETKKILTSNFINFLPEKVILIQILLKNSSFCPREPRQTPCSDSFPTKGVLAEDFRTLVHSSENIWCGGGPLALQRLLGWQRFVFNCRNLKQKLTFDQITLLIWPWPELASNHTLSWRTSFVRSLWSVGSSKQKRLKVRAGVEGLMPHSHYLARSFSISPSSSMQASPCILTLIVRHASNSATTLHGLYFSTKAIKFTRRLKC